MSGKVSGSRSCSCRGLTGFASFWHDQVAAFAKNFDVITHDHRGIGQSDLTRSGFTVDRMAADVIGLMDALEIERAHIVGHSTGGAIAQILAIEHPETARQRRAVGKLDKARRIFPPAVRVAQGYPVAPRPERLCPVQHAVPLPELVGQNATTSGCASRRRKTLPIFPPTEIAASRIDAILAFDRTESLSRIKTPTLVVGAEDDIVTPAYFSEELARLIPGAEIKIFPRGGHAFTQVRAREFTQAVLPFLASHTPA